MFLFSIDHDIFGNLLDFPSSVHPLFLLYNFAKVIFFFLEINRINWKEMWHLGKLYEGLIHTAWLYAYHSNENRRLFLISFQLIASMVLTFRWYPPLDGA